MAVLVQRKRADEAEAQQSFYKASSLVTKQRRVGKCDIFLMKAVAFTLLVMAYIIYQMQQDVEFYLDIPCNRNRDSCDVIFKTIPYCSDPDDPAEAWAILQGDAFVNIKLTEEDEKGRYKKSWKGSITNPSMKGEYTLKFFCKRGCGDNYIATTRTVFQPVDLNVDETEITGTTDTGEAEIFAKGAWINSAKIKNDVDADDELEPFPYIWSDPTKVLSHSSIKEEEWITYDDTRKILKNGVVKDGKGFYEFNRLGNYELVCWIGSQSAERLRSKFLSLRPQLFPAQRPFKFHLYPSTSLTSPDAEWDEETKKKFRKCKNIIVSMDELDSPLSQVEYRDQFTTFIQHLLTAINDDTFPIWIMTNMQSHSMVEASTEKGAKKNCYRDHESTSSLLLPRTSEHPCNEVLKMLFQQNTFPKRVHLVDNTDLSLPYRYEVEDQQKHIDHISALVALRTYVFIGKQVKDWRDVGQRGHVDGLTRRSGVEEPNFELIPYDWSSDPKPLEK